MITFFKKILTSYNISEKEFLTWVRTSVRSAWADSPMKRKIEEDTKIKVLNDNPRSMKRFPYVWKRTCAICKKEAGIFEFELDHIKGGNSLKGLEDIPSFVKSILFPSPSEVQWLCIDKYKTENKKKVLVSFGCHGIKTLSERLNVSFLEASAHKEALQIIKDKKDKEFFTLRELDIPSNLEKRRNGIVKILVKELENECSR